MVILFASSIYGQWEPNRRLTYDDSVSATSYNNAWCIAAEPIGRIHAVWQDSRDANREVYYKRSTDLGITWGPDTRLTYDSSLSYFPSVSFSGADVHVVWVDYRDGNYEIYYKRSTDSGVSWGSDIRLTNDRNSSIYPSLAASGSDVHVVWEDIRSGDLEIYYKHSTDSGSSWSPDIRLTYYSGLSFYPSIASFDTMVHVVWQDDRDGDFEIYYKRSSDRGMTWGPDTRLTQDTAQSRRPCVAVSGSKVHVVWDDDRDVRLYYPEIYYKRSSDWGLTWGSDTRLTYDTSYSLYPSVAALGSGVHVVWKESRDGNEEIYYKASRDSGVTWFSDVNLTNDTNNSVSPSVALSGTGVHVLWYDTRDGNAEIYYVRNPSGNSGITEEVNNSDHNENRFLWVRSPVRDFLFVHYRLPFDETMHLFIYDLLGRKVRVLREEFERSGRHDLKIPLYGMNLAPGIYFISLESFSINNIARVLVLR